MNEKYRIMIETSSICNAKCEFCANPTLIRPRMAMPDDIFHLIVKRLKEEKISIERFILHLNGEPFTDKQFVERIEFLKTRFSDVPIWFTTNFSLPNKSSIDRLLACGGGSDYNFPKCDGKRKILPAHGTGF